MRRLGDAGGVSLHQKEPFSKVKGGFSPVAKLPSVSRYSGADIGAGVMTPTGRARLV